MDAYDGASWAPLFGAEVGAAAALTGLIFVAASLNLTRILTYESLPHRVLKALCMLVYTLFLSTLMLVPGQPVGVLGGELTLLGLVGLIGVARLDVGAWRRTEPRYRKSLRRLLPIGLGATLATMAAGVSLLLHAGGGVYWLVPAIVLAIIAALVDAWVLLIEIAR